jgi:hypothetical protein
MSDDPNVEAWIDQARSADILEIATDMGAVLRRTGGEYVGPCPRCNGTDRFAVKPSEQVFNCRSGEGGDTIALVMHVRDVPFFEACEIINGCPAPNRESQARPIDPEIARERLQERKDQELARAAAEAKKQERGADRAARIFNDSTPILGTQAMEYLRRRAIVPPHELLGDLHFAAGLEYRGYTDPEAEDEIALGVFPCMVAAIRNVDDEIIGIHRTYLDASEPAKLKPPGDGKRNKAKKSFGTVVGGAIRLGGVRRIMAIGEGIETCLSWYQLGVGPDDIGVMSSVSLGNLSGGCNASVKHPAGRGTIPDGAPDPGKPGIILPPQVEEVIVLGDGDSDWIATHARLLVAARRFRGQGRAVSIHYAPPKADWNDVLLEQKRAA